jgi:hypothetical protein
MVEAMGLISIASRSPWMASLPNIMKIYQVVQNLIVGGHTDRQSGDLISQLHFWKVGYKHISREDKRV